MVFSALRQTVLETVLGIGAVRSCTHLVAKPSQLGVDANGMSYPLRHPTACECQPDALSVRFGKVLPCLVAKPYLEESLPIRAHMP
jgi:hypothetical protein